MEDKTKESFRPTQSSSTDTPRLSPDLMENMSKKAFQEEENRINRMSLAQAETYLQKEGAWANPHVHHRIRNLTQDSVSSVDKSSNNDDWPDPEPLQGQHLSAENYPVEVLPDIIREAVLEYQSFGQQPMPMVAQAALSAASAACQGLADVRRDDVLVGPISLSMMAIAESGERKSSCDTVFLKPIREVTDRKRVAALEKERWYTEDLAVWEAQRKRLHSEAAKFKTQAATKSGDTKQSALEKLDNIKDQIRIHLNDRPKPVRVPTFFYSDITPQGIGRQLNENDFVGSVWESEAGVTFGSVGMSAPNFVTQSLGTLNKLWDGAALDAIRADSGRNFRVYGRRVSVNLMIQPVVLNEYLINAGKTARGSGFLGRFLITAPPSTMGTRVYQAPPSQMPACTRFSDRLEKLMSEELPLNEPGTELLLPMVGMNEPARANWIDFVNDVEQKLSADCDFYEIRDAAAKAGDNAARIAAVFHLLANRTEVDDIDEHTMRSAITLMYWYLDEFNRALKDASPPEVLDAEILLSWLLKQDDFRHTPRQIQQLGPRATRQKTRRDAALKVLETHAYVRIVKWGSQIKQVVINPKIRP